VRAGDISVSFGLRKRCFAATTDFCTTASGWSMIGGPRYPWRPAMAEIINLNRWRKTKAKEEKARQADANRVAFGRSKAEKQAVRKQADLQDKDLDGKKLDE